MTTEILVNIGSGNGSLPDGTEPLPEPKLINHQLGLEAFTWGQFHRKWSRYLSLMWIWKITNLELQPHLPEANELRSNFRNSRNVLENVILKMLPFCSGFNVLIYRTTVNSQEHLMVMWSTSFYLIENYHAQLRETDLMSRVVQVGQLHSCAS